MNFVNILYPIVLIALCSSLLLTPALITIAFIPKRLAAARHAVLAATFVSALAWPAFGPFLTMRVLEPVGAAVSSISAKNVDRPQDTQPMPAEPIRGKPPLASKFKMPASFQPNWEASSVFYRDLRIAVFSWFGLGYMLSLLLLVGSKRSRRRSDVRVSARARVPVSLWFFRPIIVMPMQSEEWSDERFERVIAHEQAHLDRKDWLWQACANMFVAYNALNPLGWLCLRKLRYEAECVADQRVLLTSANPAEYATDLLEIAKLVRRPVNVAFVAIVSHSTLRGRVRTILKGSKPVGESKYVIGAASVDVKC
jgi:hypothetical protein